jgi:hypothetical protein
MTSESGDGHVFRVMSPEVERCFHDLFDETARLSGAARGDKKIETMVSEFRKVDGFEIAIFSGIMYVDRMHVFGAEYKDDVLARMAKTGWSFEVTPMDGDDMGEWIWSELDKGDGCFPHLEFPRLMQTVVLELELDDAVRGRMATVLRFVGPGRIQVTADGVAKVAESVVKKFGLAPGAVSIKTRECVDYVGSHTTRVNCYKDVIFYTAHSIGAITGEGDVYFDVYWYRAKGNPIK